MNAELGISHRGRGFEVKHMERKRNKNKITTTKVSPEAFIWLSDNVTWAHWTVNYSRGYFVTKQRDNSAQQ
jgi:hypothetical protein